MHFVLDVTLWSVGVCAHPFALCVSATRLNLAIVPGPTIEISCC